MNTYPDIVVFVDGRTAARIAHREATNQAVAELSKLVTQFQARACERLLASEGIGNGDRDRRVAKGEAVAYAQAAALLETQLSFIKHGVTA